MERGRKQFKKRPGPAPMFWEGDVVTITNTGWEIAGKYEGLEAQIVENRGRTRRAAGSKITAGLYRVYIPELDVFRTIKSHNLTLLEPGDPSKERYSAASPWEEELRERALASRVGRPSYLVEDGYIEGEYREVHPVEGERIESEFREIR